MDINDWKDEEKGKSKNADKTSKTPSQVQSVAVRNSQNIVLKKKFVKSRLITMNKFLLFVIAIISLGGLLFPRAPLSVNHISEIRSKCYIRTCRDFNYEQKSYSSLPELDNLHFKM